MKIKYLIFWMLAFALILMGTASAQKIDPKPRADKALKANGVYFEIEISSKGEKAVLWKNWRDGNKYRGEAEIAGSPNITIIDGDFTYTLSPNIKVARKSKIVKDEKKNPLASKYGVLADIPQLDPMNYASTIRRLGAQIQAPSPDVDGKKADLYSLKITDPSNFPWNNFMIWIEKETSLPIKIQYQEGNESRTIKFVKIEKELAIDESKFAIPKDYKVIEFEWD